MPLTPSNRKTAYIVAAATVIAAGALVATAEDNGGPTTVLGNGPHHLTCKSKGPISGSQGDPLSFDVVCAPRTTTTTVPVTTTTVPGPTTTTPGGQALKPRLSGIVADAGQVPARFQSVVKAFTFNVNWSDLEPTQGNFDFSTIDTKVATAHNLGERILLRVEAGINAPGWAQNIGGPPISLCDPQGGGCGAVGRWWTQPYQAAYADLQSHLGARYDSRPEIGKVAESECQTIFAECFHIGGTAGAQALHAAGLTDAIQAQAIAQALDSTMTAWPTTEVHLALVNWQDVDNGGATNDAFTVSVASAARTKYGGHLVTGWNGARDPLLPLSVYQQWIADNPPADGQTATPARIGNPVAAVDEAAKVLHYGSIEISGDGNLGQFTPANIAPLQAELAANASV